MCFLSKALGSSTNGGENDNDIGATNRNESHSCKKSPSRHFSNTRYMKLKKNKYLMYWYERREILA